MEEQDLSVASNIGNTSKGSGFSGELIHFHVVRMRVVGSGNLKLTLHSLDDIENQDLADTPLAVAANREPTTLSNFIQQRAQLEFFTEDIGEFFNISSIAIFIKPVATGYPQT